ncbi:MAG TPA: heme lyase CcmF/NrfE family subunit, partial [Dehalococcoidia bacterium]|nr:heme lyase CcmF/NrfE family subunit [Dehalococcoidia bacterium]
MTEVGYAAILIALVIAAYVTVASLLSAQGRTAPLWLSARNGVFAVLGLTTVASAALVYSFFARDFSLSYVAAYSSRDLSPIYTFAAWWAGLDGSLLFWAWLLSLFTAIVVLQNRRRHQELMPYVTACMMALLAFFLGVMVFVANPFEKLPSIPADGRGLNPLLENPGMLFHPPSLYLGYVGFTVPFAFAMAALASGRLSDQWIRSTRRWTLLAWLFLSLGNIFGMQWAYVELGWGGFWGWDPVENASFMPWLTGTAYLHSVMIQQKRGMLKVWNFVLIIATFALSLFGTMLTRSGILSSVHSFSESAVGPLFIGLMAVVLALSVQLLWQRLPKLRGEHELDSLVSREASFLLNNLLLVGIAFAVFWGTIFPLISEAVRGVKIVVGPPFFNQVTLPIFFALIVLMGVCPLIGWRKASLENLARNFIYPLALSLLMAVTLYVLGMRPLYVVVALWALGFVIATLVLEFYRGVRARHRGHGDNYMVALPRLVWDNKPRYGGYIVHIGILLLALSIVVGEAYKATAEATLAPGETMSIKQYELTFLGLSERPTPSKDIFSARLAVANGGSSLGEVVPEKYFPRNHPNPVTEVAIRSTIREDLYVILTGWTEDGKASFKVLVNPLMMWMWIGGGVAVAGTAIAFWPDPRERRRALAVASRPLRRREAEGA